jgi:YbgC/YbaW family acyl-CoA thioester hydrolase
MMKITPGTIMKKYSQTLKVRSYELDSQGHVNYAVYLHYLEYCRVATLEQVGLPFQDYIKQGKFVVVAEVNIKYLAPAFLGDELEITMAGVKAGRTSVTIKQEIFNKKTGKQLIDAQLIAVFINHEGKPVPIDEDFRNIFFTDNPG